MYTDIYSNISSSLPFPTCTGQLCISFCFERPVSHCTSPIWLCTGCVKVFIFSTGILHKPKYISSRNHKSLGSRTQKPVVDDDSLVRKVVERQLHPLFSLIDTKPGANLIISQVLRVNCSSSGSWFPYRRSRRTWRPVRSVSPLW